jgi:hypothetical protein
MGPLEQEVTELLQSPVADTYGSLYYAAGDTTNWWDALTREQRDQLILLTFAGISDAIRRLASHIDKTEAAADRARRD